MTTRRVDGFAPIEEYAVLTDGRTSALISLDGRVEWWPVPTIDAPLVCGSLLDPDGGGYLALAPEGEFSVERHYVEDTNVLESVFTTEEGQVRVTTSLNMAATGRLPWSELALRVEGLAGEVAVRATFVASTHFHTAEPSSSKEGGVAVLRVGTQTIAIVADGALDVVLSEHGASLTHQVRPGSSLVLGLIASDREPLFVPSSTEVDRRIDDTVDNWRRWTALVEAPEPYRDACVRSALALKSLIAEYTGAIAAAATTSLPERIGTDKNWDYRFSWVRDSSFAIDALMNLGLDEEVHNAVAWLLRAICANGPDLHVFYTLEGEVPGKEETLEARGYRDSQPVRSGNGAARQRQLGNFGDVLDTVYRYVEQGNLLDVTSRAQLAALVEQCCRQWTKPDSGIWELHETRHYTISKIGCWVALDRAVKLVECGQLAGDVARWRDEREKVRAFIETECWSESKQSYTFFAGTEDLDAAVLLSARTGFDVGERLVTTIDAIVAELGRGPLVYRYSGAEASEGAFVACTYWLVEALAGTNQRERALALMDEALTLPNDVGLLAEQIDPGSRSFLGNVPQALSHLALINAAHALSRPRGRGAE